MFKVVADVEQYPRFLPWVVGLRVLSREPMSDGREVVLAEMGVGYGALRERYTSRILLKPFSPRAIDVVQTEGPFRQLENHWQFTSENGGCRVDFSIAFEFRSRMLNAVATKAFSRIMLRMADAFEARARALSDQTVQKA